MNLFYVNLKKGNTISINDLFSIKLLNVSDGGINVELYTDKWPNLNCYRRKVSKYYPGFYMQNKITYMSGKPLTQCVKNKSVMDLEFNNQSIKFDFVKQDDLESVTFCFYYKPGSKMFINEDSKKIENKIVKKI